LSIVTNSVHAFITYRKKCLEKSPKKRIHSNSARIRLRVCQTRRIYIRIILTEQAATFASKTPNTTIIHQPIDSRPCLSRRKPIHSRPKSCKDATHCVSPNPVNRQSGIVNFFAGVPLAGARDAVDVRGTLTVFDASGNVVNRVAVSYDHPAASRHPSTGGEFGRWVIGSWDLTDRRGRLVGEGTYLVRGVVTTSDGKKERVSVMIGVN